MSVAAQTVFACLSETDVRALFGGSIEDHVLERIDAHVAECDTCRRRLAEFARKQAASDVDTETEQQVASFASGLRPYASLLPMVEALVRRRSKYGPGTVLAGKWTLERLLGEGGMARVYAAVHANGRKVAIKILRPELCEDAEIVRRFVQEAVTANRVEHPNVVAVLDNDVDDDGTPYLVMERLEGETLRARIERGPVPIDEARAIGLDLLDALEVAHAQGIVHRDIKPENVFLVRQGSAKLLDFGIARVYSAAAQRDGTRSGVTIGTPAYMAPEQARGESSRIGARTDLWALGATLFSAVTASTVHGSVRGENLLFHAMVDKAPPLHSVLPDAPKPFAEVIDRALAFEPEDRFADAASMRRALRGELLASDTSPPARRTEHPSRSVRSLAPILAVGVAALALGYVGFTRLFDRPADARASSVAAHDDVVQVSQVSTAVPPPQASAASPSAPPSAPVTTPSSAARSPSSPSSPPSTRSPRPTVRSHGAVAPSTAAASSASPPPLPTPSASPPSSGKGLDDDAMLQRRH